LGSGRFFTVFGTFSYIHSRLVRTQWGSSFSNNPLEKIFQT